MALIVGITVIGKPTKSFKCVVGLVRAHDTCIIAPNSGKSHIAVVGDAKGFVVVVNIQSSQSVVIGQRVCKRNHNFIVNRDEIQIKYFQC